MTKPSAGALTPNGPRRASWSGSVARTRTGPNAASSPTPRATRRSSPLRSPPAQLDDARVALQQPAGPAREHDGDGARERAAVEVVPVRVRDERRVELAEV